MKHKIITILTLLGLLVGCATMLPTSQRTIELPTQKYSDPSGYSIQRGHEIIKVIRLACLEDKSFEIEHEGSREKYKCTLEK